MFLRIRDLEIEVRRSSRETAVLQVYPDGRLVLRAPLHMPDKMLESFAESRYDWLRNHRDRALAKRCEAEEKRGGEKAQRLTIEEIRQLADQAVADIGARVRHFAPVVGVSVGRITIRNQRSKWGSCSAKGNLNFNCLLMLAPEKVRDYVVVHELCHRLEMNHSPRFWAHVGAVMPDYRTQREWLKVHGIELMERMTGGTI